MIIVSVVFLCVIFLLYLINFTLCFSIKGKVDLFDNSGDFAVKFFFFTITKGKMHFGQDKQTHNSLIIERRGDRRTDVHISADKEDTQSLVSYMDAPLFRNMLIRDIEATFRLGKSDDAFFTTMSVVAVRAIFYTVVSILKSRQSFSHRQSFEPSFNKDKLEAEFSGIISISIADIIYSFIRHKLECRGKKCGKSAIGKKVASGK